MQPERPERTEQGSTADYCSRWPGEPHAMVTHLYGGSLVSVRMCSSCDWIDFGDLDEQVREQGIAEGLHQATEGPAFLDADAYRVGEALEDYYRRVGSPPSMTRPYAAAYIALEAATADGRRLVGPWVPAPSVNAELSDAAEQPEGDAQ